MYWWPYDDKSMTFWKFVPVEPVESTGSSTQTVSDRNYESLLQYCNKLQKQNQQLKSQICSLHKKMRSRRQRKIKRRPQNELMKNYHCLYPNCKKQYASSLALNLHMKIKHNAGSKRDRLMIANQILKAEAQGREFPKVSINLPPNYLESIKTLKKDLISSNSEEHQRKKTQQAQKQV